MEDHELTLVGIGWEPSDPDRILRSFVREHYRIHYISKGCGYLAQTNHTYRLSKGDGFVIYPGQAADYYPERSDPWEYVWMGASGSSFERLCRECGLRREMPIFQVSDAMVADDSVMKLFSAAVNDRGDEFYLQCLQEFFSHMAPLTEARRRENRYFEKCLDFIHKNYMRPISIGSMASSLSIDRTYIYKLFKKNINASPQQYLITHRLSKACDLLIATDLSVSEIAFQVGFGEISNFTRQFKKYHHISATEYRKKSKNWSCYSKITPGSTVFQQS